MSDTDTTTETGGTDGETLESETETMRFDESMSAQNEVESTDRNTEDATGRDQSSTESDDTSEVLYQTSPLVRPVLGLMGTIVVIATLGCGVLLLNPSLAGGPELANLILNAILVLTAVVLLRLGVTVVVLHRTTYTIRTDGFEASYQLAYRENERRIPSTQLRGQELDRGRYQSLFGCATIRLLTGGTNRSLGFVEFQSVPDPAAVQETVRNVRKANEAADEGAH